jgi:murein DD-endopeptidase MepM/ murein hydrolase activator NlpD
VRAPLALSVALFAAASCASPPPEELGALESTLGAAERRARATIIRDTARARGITDGALMIALLAEEETYLSHCASEFPACPGPNSSDCGGRAVISGGGDGPCSINQGGLGMFQIDDGTESDTVRVHGDRVLTLVGNTEVAIDRVLDKLVRSHYVGISTRAEAVTFLNALRIDDANWDPYIRTLVRYWNGCPESAACWSNRYPKYNAAGRTLLREMGREFWYGTPAPMAATGWLSSPIDPPRVTSFVTHARSGGGWERYDCARQTRANHRGTDYGVAIGTPVRAAAAGTVIRSTTGCGNDGSMSSTCGGGFGNHVIVLHSGGFATLYAHLSPDGTQVRNGTRLECGELVGRSGNSGRSSGPHLHFEVRSGVSDVGSYFRSNNTVDPYGGACSTQTDSLWTGGSPMASCMPAQMRDDAVVTGSTYPREIAGTPGAMITQTIYWRNRGTTTWTPDGYLMRHQSGAFADASMIELPAGAMIQPGQRLALRVTVTVPSASGLHRGVWRMARRDGASFGTDAYLEVRVPAAPRECDSYTLGRRVPSGSCVQVAYAGCGLEECAWFRCADGSWACTEEGTCTGESFPNGECAPPMPDGGVDGGSTCASGAGQGETCAGDEDCCAGLTCSADDVGARACCIGRGAPCGSSAECCGSTLCEMGFCECVPEGQLCWNDTDCCDGFACLAGACRDVSGCTREATACAADGECCWPLRCEAAPEGGRQCCTGAGNRCESDAECCGDMACTAGYCVCRAIGESCSNLLDCCGALLCNDGTCG